MYRCSAISLLLAHNLIIAEHNFNYSFHLYRLFVCSFAYPEQWLYQLLLVIQVCLQVTLIPPTRHLYFFVYHGFLYYSAFSFNIGLHSASHVFDDEEEEIDIMNHRYDSCSFVFLCFLLYLFLYPVDTSTFTSYFVSSFI